MGSIPNLYYRAISMDQLRAHPHFNGLPPVEKVPLYNTQSYRYIRQDNPLWDALHSGVLTTGILNGTLGFYEQGASKRLGIPWSMVSHAPLLTAYNRLQEPIYTPPLMQAPMHSTSAAGTAPSMLPAAARGDQQPGTAFPPHHMPQPEGAVRKQHSGSSSGKARRRKRHRAKKAAAAAADGDAAGGPAGTAACADTPSTSNASKLEAADRCASSASSTVQPAAAALSASTLPHEQPGGNTPAADQADSARSTVRPAPAAHFGAVLSRGHPEGETLPGSLPEASAEIQAHWRAKSVRKAEAGGHAVRLAWGNAQEASALYSLMHVFPESALQEVGLCWLEPQDLPPEWGFKAGDLPPLGASPDGLLRHFVPAGTADTAEDAAAEVATGADQQDTHTAAAQSAAAAASRRNFFALSSHQGAGTQLPACAAQQPVEQLLQHFKALQVQSDSTAPSRGRIDAGGAAVTSGVATSCVDQPAGAMQPVVQHQLGAAAPLHRQCKQPQDPHQPCETPEQEESAANGLAPGQLAAGSLAQHAAAGIAATGPSRSARRSRARRKRAEQQQPTGQASTAPAAAGVQLAAKPFRPAAADGTQATPSSESALADESRPPTAPSTQVPAGSGKGAVDGSDTGKPAPGKEAAALDEIDALLAEIDASSSGASRNLQPRGDGTEACNDGNSRAQGSKQAPSGAAAVLADDSIIRLGPPVGPPASGGPEDESAACSWLSEAEIAAFHAWEQRYQAPRGQLGAGMKVVLEMVEVKNTSPFQQHATMTRRGKPRVHYALSDRGPRQQVPTYWVPQLQMEMLAGGASSALLVSRSATKGMTLFRMARDDSYLRQMLAIISRFYRTYVRRNCRPPYNMFSERPDYQQFLRHTASLARETPALLHVPEPAVPPGSSKYLFLGGKS